MLTTLTQRWRERRDSYRPAGEAIATSRYEVAPIADDTTARAFVLKHHYSASYPAARWRFGLWRGPDLVGVAVFSHPSNDRTLTNVFPCPALEAVELGRFVLLDDVPANGESWMLGRCFELLRAESLFGVLSFSDPLPRTDAAGVTVHAGHVGTIYQAHNARYLGRAKARTLRVLPAGTVFSDRTAQKIRQRERGWRAAVLVLELAGAGAFDGSAGWLARALETCARKIRHPGNHRYAWALARRDWRRLPPGLPYPKLNHREMSVGVFE